MTADNPPNALEALGDYVGARPGLLAQTSYTAIPDKLDEIREHYGAELHICADQRTAPYARDTNSDFQWLVAEVERLRRDAREVCAPTLERQAKEVERLRKANVVLTNELQRLALQALANVSAVGDRMGDALAVLRPSGPVDEAKPC